MTVKELKTNNMGYTPYKMLGHELKGIKQRAPGKMSMEKTHINDKMVDGVSKKSGVLYKEGSGVGSSPAKGWFSNIAKKVGGFAKKAMDPLGLKDKAKKALGIGGDDSAGGGDTAGLEARVSALEESSGGGETAAVAGGGEEAPWEAMDKKEFLTMEKGARKEYMGGLDKSQRAQQMQGVMAGGGSGWGGIGNAVGGMFSDIRLKEKIEKTGKSPSGIPTYEFNYIGDNNRYSGVMAQDLIEMNIDAVSMDDSGFYKVDYNNIDVDMHLIN
jgi:hypothetical protein